MVIFMFRKFLAALVLALHVTPGRRLLATFQKYSRCREFLNPPDGFEKALRDLLNGEGWSNSVEDLGTAVGAPKDNAEDFIKNNTVRVLRAIVDKLLKSKDFKVRDMAVRHEINLEIKTSFEGECSHNPSTVTSERAVALSVAGCQGETMTFAELQYHLKIMKLSREEKDCQQCGKVVVKTVQSSVKEYWDPDFLTIVFEHPTNFKAPLKAGIKYGSSRYEVKTVVHWESCKSSASVSREAKEGWWWHGVVDTQGLDFRYTAEQLHSSTHLRDVAVMMMVRMGEENDCQETERQPANLNYGQGQRKQEEEGRKYPSVNSIMILFRYSIAKAIM